MSQLVDHQIRREQERSMEPYIRLPVPSKGADPADYAMINPFYPQQVKTASYDVRLGGEFRTEQDQVYQHAVDGNPYRLATGAFVLGHTLEYVRIPAHMCARVEGKSSTGRRGLGVHVTAGFIDPGFEGQITLELVNHSRFHIFDLQPGMLIAQLTFHYLSHRPEHLYGSPSANSHYQGQTGATPAATT